MSRLFALAIICLFSISSGAQKVFDFNSTCQQAYLEITKLKLGVGQQLINEARSQNANNLIPYLLEGYIDFFVLFFNEDPNEYKRRKNNFNVRLDAFDEGSQSSPFYNYCRAITFIQRAAVEIKFGERLGAGLDFKKAFSLIKQNRRDFPRFMPNNMIYGPLQVVIGTVPKNYRWAANLFGLRGSISEGMNTMRSFLNSNDQYARLFQNEAAFYYCYLKYYLENKPDEVFRFINTRKLDLVNNHLFTYLAANLGINNKQTDFARNVILRRNTSPEYLSTSVWDFELGYAKLHHLECQEAIVYFERFIRNFKGRFYVKDVLQKISWAHYLLGNMPAAENARQRLLRSGNTDTDADKKAQKDAKSNLWPNMLLLKARLLSDGGYHREALGLLHGKSSASFADRGQALEFNYRVARIYDDLGNDDTAVTAYLAAIKLGENRKEYYAARAALQIGYIYEKRGNKAQAIAYYERCISMEDHEYKDSLDQRAKAGIARCKGQ